MVWGGRMTSCKALPTKISENNLAEPYKKSRKPYKQIEKTMKNVEKAIWKMEKII